MNSINLLKELQCTICLNTFTLPFILQCGHSFCRDCIFEYSKISKTQKCPLCKSAFQRSKLSLNISLECVLRELGNYDNKENEVNTKKQSNSKYFYICTSNLPYEFKIKFEKFCTQFNVRVNQTFNPRTTHLIAGPAELDPRIAKRTQKFIQAMIKGVWILSIDWVLDSLKGDIIIQEEPYEIQGDENIMNGPRLSRLNFGNGTLLEEFVFSIDDSGKAAVDGDYISDIVKQCGGTIVKLNKKNHQPIIIKIVDDPIINREWREVNPIQVNQKWLFDSISRCQMQSYFDYLVD